MPSHWVCSTEKCGRKGEVFSSDSEELATCPSCEQALEPLDQDFDHNEERGQNLAQLTDAYLARGLIGALAAGESDVRFYEAEVRRRHGYHTKPQEWAEAEVTSGKRVYGLRPEEGGWGQGVNVGSNKKKEKK